MGAQFANRSASPTKEAPKQAARAPSSSGKYHAVMCACSKIVCCKCIAASLCSGVQQSDCSCLFPDKVKQFCLKWHRPVKQVACLGPSCMLRLTCNSCCLPIWHPVAGTSRPASSGGGFFDNAVGAQFAKKSETPTRAASPRPTSSRPTSSRPTSPRPTSSGGGFFDNAVGAQFAKKSETPSRAAPATPAPKQAASGKFAEFCLTAIACPVTVACLSNDE